MEIIIHPYQGIEIPGKGRISFGMTRKRVRSFFSEQPDEVLVSETSPMPRDDYYESLLNFSYDSLGLLEAIMIVSPYDPIFQGQHLLYNHYRQIKDLFLQIDSNVEIEDYVGLTSYKFGIHIYAPEAPEEGADYVAESVLSFKKGYYDN